MYNWEVEIILQKKTLYKELYKQGAPELIRFLEARDMSSIEREVNQLKNEYFLGDSTYSSVYIAALLRKPIHLKVLLNNDSHKSLLDLEQISLIVNEVKCQAIATVVSEYMNCHYQTTENVIFYPMKSEIGTMHFNDKTAFTIPIQLEGTGFIV